MKKIRKAKQTTNKQKTITRKKRRRKRTAEPRLSINFMHGTQVAVCGYMHMWEGSASGSTTSHF